MKTTLDHSGISIQELPKKITASKQTGTTTTRYFKGKSEDITAMYNLLYEAGYSVAITEGPLWLLEASIGSSVDGSGNPTNNENELVVQWELLSQPQEKSILESNEVFVRMLPAVYLKAIKDAIKNQTGELALPYNPNIWEGHTTAANALYNLIQHGYERYVFNQPILRRSVSPYINFPLQNFTSNVGNIYSTNTLKSVENIPANFAYVLPVDVDPDPADTDDIVLHWGWLKQYPSVMQVSNQRLQVNQDWVYGLYSHIVYGNAL